MSRPHQASACDSDRGVSPDLSHFQEINVDTNFVFQVEKQLDLSGPEQIQVKFLIIEFV